MAKNVKILIFRLKVKIFQKIIVDIFTGNTPRVNLAKLFFFVADADAK